VNPFSYICILIKKQEKNRYIRIEDLGTYLVRTSHNLDMIEVLSWIKKTDNSIEEATEVSKLKILKEIARLDDTFEQLKLKSK
jgi:hypothetical protein